MKLLYFTPQLYGNGGVERTLIDKANFLVRNGHDIHFVTFVNGNLPTYYKLSPNISLTDLDVRFHSVYQLSFICRILRFMKMRKQFIRRMRNVINSFNPDVIVIATPETDLLIHDIISLAQGRRIVVESHVRFDSHFSGRPLTEKLLYLFYSPLKAIRKVDLLITLTKGDAECWRAHHVKKICIIPNPLTFYPNELDHVKKEEGRIICIGRLDVQKRFDRVIDAFSLIALKFPQWYIDIYGEGKEKNNLQNQIDKLKLTSRIHLMGPTNDVFTELLRSQFFVFCSDFEGFGLVLIEAMACGIPCVSTDCQFGPSEIIADTQTGLLCQMNVIDLSEKMEWMICHDADRRRMGVNARKAAARYKMNIVMEEWANAYFNR